MGVIEETEKSFSDESTL